MAVSSSSSASVPTASFPTFAEFFLDSLHKESLCERHPLYTISKKNYTSLEGQTLTSRIVSFLTDHPINSSDQTARNVMKNLLIRFEHIKIGCQSSSDNEIPKRIHSWVHHEDLKANHSLLKAYRKFFEAYPAGYTTFDLVQGTNKFSVPEPLIRAQWGLDELCPDSSCIVPDHIILSEGVVKAFEKCLLGYTLGGMEGSVKLYTLQLLDFCGARELHETLSTDMTNPRKKRTINEVVDNYIAVDATAEPDVQPNKIRKIQDIRIALRRALKQGDYSGLNTTDPDVNRLVEIVKKIVSRQNIQFSDMSVNCVRCDTMVVRKTFNLGPGQFTAKKISDMQFLLNQSQVARIYISRKATVNIECLCRVLSGVSCVQYLVLSQEHLHNDDKQKLELTSPSLTVQIIEDVALKELTD